jgi:TolB-like protein
MRCRTGLLVALTLAAWPALWGCAGGPPYRDPEWPGYTWGGRGEAQKADPSQVQQQLAALTAQLSVDMRARQVQRIAVLPFENTSGSNPESLGAYLTEKITNLFYAERVGTVVERTYLKKVVDEIERGYSGPFDPLSLKEIGHLLNADTLVLGSYTKLANGTTEVMARAVSVETGEIVGASSAMISGKIVPNGPIVVREPLLAQSDVPSTALPESGWRPPEQEGLGTFNVVPSPAPGIAYSSYLPPQVVVPSYSYAPRIGTPFYRFVPRTVSPPLSFARTWRPRPPFSHSSHLSRPSSSPPVASRPSGHRGSRR